METLGAKFQWFMGETLRVSVQGQYRIARGDHEMGTSLFQV